ncbi:MAG: hypothetical protein HY646_07420, partial [Acidobacteria bacterium]|nr:hypothetical protein [Acidobacteriota bacterium]
MRPSVLTAGFMWCPHEADYTIAYRVYAPDGKLLFTRGADCEQLEVTLPNDKFDSGAEVSVQLRAHSGQADGIVPAAWRLPGDARLRNPSAFAFAQEFGTDQWHPLALQRGSASDTYTLGLPPDLHGLYRLRFTLSSDPEPPACRSLRCDFWVAITSPGAKGSLTVFSDRNRRVYQGGEPIDLNVALRAAQDLPSVSANLILADASGQVLGRHPVAFPALATGTSRTASLVLPESFTRALKPGDYLVSAAVDQGGVKVGFKRLTVVSPIRPTSFQTALHPLTLWTDLADAQSLARVHASLGFNRVVVVAPTANNLTVTQAKRLLEADSRLPAAETAFQLSNLEAYIESALEHGISVMVQPFCHFIHPVYLPEEMPLHQAYSQRLAQRLERYPNFLGINYHDIHYKPSDYPDRFAKAQALFEQRLGMKPPTHAELAAYRNDPKDTALRQRALHWLNFLTDLLPDAHKQWREAVHQAAPRLITSVLPWWEMSTDDGSYLLKMYANMDEVAVHNSGEQYMELSAAPHLVDQSRRPGKSVISYGQTSYQEPGDGQSWYREYFLTLLRGVQGVGHSGFNFFAEKKLPDQMQVPALTEMHQLLTRYGDFLSGLQPHEEVAVLNSFTQSAFETGLPANLKQWERTFGAYLTCLMAHYPASILYEEDLAAGALKNFKVLILTGIQVPLPEAVVQSLQAFVQAGGKVLADEACTQAPSFAEELPVKFQWHRQRTNPEMQFFYSDAKHFLIEESVLDKVPILRRTLSQYVKPLADCASPQVWLSEQRSGAARYLFVANTTRVPHRPEDLWRFSSFETTSMPVKETISLAPGNDAIYDVLSGKRVTAQEANGRRLLEADLTLLPGRIFALLPAAIADVRLEAPAQIEAGQPLVVRAAGLDQQARSLQALVPIEVLVQDANGQTRYHLFRAANEKGWEESLPTALNDATGDWRIAVTELFSGLTRTASVRVRPSSGQPAQLVEAPPVEIGRQPDLRAWLQRSKTIALIADKEQESSLTEPIQQLLDTLKVKGVTVARLTSQEYSEDAPPGFHNAGNLQEIPKRKQPFDEILLLGMPGAESALLKRMQAEDQLAALQSSAPRRWSA